MVIRHLVRATAVLALCAASASGQLPKRLEKCLPYPTLAKEIKDMQYVPPKVLVRVVDVEFDEKSGIPADAQEQISAELRAHIYEVDSDSDYLNDVANEIAEVGVRGPLQDRGYFRTTTAAKLSLVRSEGKEIEVAANIGANPGTQYRLGDIRVESADGKSPLMISPEVLRGLIPLERGELLNVERLRAGLKNITRAYARLGYIDETAGPDFEIDDAQRTVDVILKIDEQVAYSVGSIEFWGIKQTAREKLMESLWKPGEVFDATGLEEFFATNRAILPVDASRRDVRITRDVKARTVALLFDLRTCQTLGEQ